jgi:predicted SprT family Zn-dependent metalloprotease
MSDYDVCMAIFDCLELGTIQNYFIRTTNVITPDILSAYTDVILPRFMRKYGHGGLIGWKHDYSARYTNAGAKTFYMKKTIVVSRWILNSHLTKFSDLNDLFLHEIAHANAWMKHGDIGHGPNWKREAQLIGCSAERCLPRKYLMTNHNLYKLECDFIDDPCIVKCLLKFNPKNPSKLKTKAVLKCKKHQLKLQVVQHIMDNKVVEDFISKMSFGINNDDVNDVVYIDDGDIIEVDGDGNVDLVEPNVCVSICGETAS